MKNIKGGCDKGHSLLLCPRIIVETCAKSRWLMRTLFNYLGTIVRIF